MKPTLIADQKPAFWGLDVAKGKADVCLLCADGKCFEECFENSRQGQQALLAWLERLAPGRRVHAGLESTGPYSRPWCELLHAAGYAVSLLNPARPKAYAQACGRRNKTDRVDARVLAEFVAERKPVRWSPPPPVPGAA